VTEVAVGDRVALPWLGYACGTCDHCTTGWETLCEKQLNTGYSIDGGYAEYPKASARYVATVSAGVDPLDAAPLTCAGVTTYKAVKLSGARPASLVAVFGIGGLGHLALQYAKIFGASVVAVDVVDDKLDLARELGADFTVNALTQDPVQAIRDPAESAGGGCRRTAAASRCPRPQPVVRPATLVSISARTRRS
jgi:propanol-preferring alcohol dehydrogenase